MVGGGEREVERVKVEAEKSNGEEGIEGPR